MNTDPEFIKKGVVAEESEEVQIKTATDEVQDRVKCCSPNGCCCRKSKGANNADSK
jgi:hypothetical protein